MNTTVQTGYLVEEASVERTKRTGHVVLPGFARLALITLNFLLQAVPLWAMYATGQSWPLFVMAGALLGVVPALDHLLDRWNFSFDAKVSEANHRRLLMLQGLYLLCTFSMVVMLGASGRVPLWSAIAATVTVGIINVHIPVVAHDFGHKMDRWNRTISNAICAIGGLGYFMPQHVMGHHVKVATPEDCATARFGQTSYGFIVKSFVPEVIGGITLEAERLRKRGLPVWSLHNDVIVAYGMTIVLAGALIAAFGWAALPWIALHHASVWFSLMLNDYIQHYGLAREKLPSGKYEPQTPAHSWSANAPLCNLMVFNVQRHAHHHARPMLSYQELVELEDGPKCPTGYFGMMAIALNPLWWRMVMDPRTVAAAKGRRSGILVHSSAEKRVERLIAQYRAANPEKADEAPCPKAEQPLFFPDGDTRNPGSAGSPAEDSVGARHEV